MKAFLLPLLLLVSSLAFAQQSVYKDFEVDSTAQPRGGMVYLHAFLEANLRKPFQAEASGFGGRVILSGVVDTDGRITEVKVIRGIRPDCDREAQRVFSLYNAWKPAVKSGKPVQQEVTVPVLFKTNKPFPYINGDRISYFDSNGKALPDSNETVRYKQVIPVDTNGLPVADAIIYQRKRSSWNEFGRLTYTRKKEPKGSLSGKAVYRVGHLDANQLWQGNSFWVTETGTILRQAYYTDGRDTGLDLVYYDNGALNHKRAENTDGSFTITSWYPNGQIKKIYSVATKNPFETGQPELITAFWDSTGHQLVNNGNGQVVYNFSVKSYADTTRQTSFVEQGTYLGGYKQGTWTGRYADGSYSYEEKYDRGICQGGQSRIGQGEWVSYNRALQHPEFQGGMAGLGQYLAQNIHYPGDAQKAGLQGKVFVSFVVCTDGTLCDYEVLKGVAPSLDQEAVRVVKSMSGKWKPGVQRGQKVRVKYNLPITFSLQ